MGYRVEYGSVKKVRDIHRCRSHVAALTGLCLLLFFFLVGQCWPSGAAVLKDVLIPENAAVAAAAMEDMAQDLLDGASLWDAARDFLRAVAETVRNP